METEEQDIRNLFSSDSLDDTNEDKILGEFDDGEEYQIVKDIDYDPNEFIEDNKAEYVISKELSKYQQQLELSFALRISLQTPSVLNSISETIYKNLGGPIACLDDISDVIFYEYAKRIFNIQYLFNLALVNKHYNNTFKKNYYTLTKLFLEIREIPFQKSIRYCKKMVKRNMDLIRKITGVNEIFTNKKKKRKTVRILCPRIMLFRMVAQCDDQYRIINNTPIYLKIRIDYKHGEQDFYFYQNYNGGELKEGCDNKDAKEILR